MTGRLVEATWEFGVQPLIEPVMNIVALNVPDIDRVRRELRTKGWFIS